MSSQRPAYAGPESGPEKPYPIQLSGKIIKGFGRGSKELGIPTANIPITGLDVGGHKDVESGVYFGFAGLHLAHATSARHAAAPLGSDESTPGERAPLGGAAGSLVSATGESGAVVHPMVMSIGWNPFYKNEVRSVEVHIMHSFDHDFYNAHMNLAILGFIRPERDYPDLEELVQDIRMDIEVARRSLLREGWAKHKEDEYLTNFSWVKPEV